MAVTQHVIIVTGAGGGMGKAIIEDQLGKGHIVIGLDLSVTSLAHLAQQSLQTYEVNVLQEDSIQAIVHEVYVKYGRIDGLVNALGIAQAATPIEQVTMDDWNRLMDVNVKSLFITTKYHCAVYEEAEKRFDCDHCIDFCGASSSRFAGVYCF